MFTWLLYCAAPQVEQARIGRLLAGVLIMLSALDLLASLPSFFINHNPSISPYAIIALIIFVALYFVNRRGGVTFTAIGLLGLILVIIPLSALNQQSNIDAGQPNSGSAVMLPVLMVIVVALAGMILSWRGVLLVTLLVTLAMGLMANVTSPGLIHYRTVNPQDTFTAMLLGLITVWAVGGLVAFYSHQMRQILIRLEQRNADLATQSARESALIAQMQTTAAQVSGWAAQIAAGAAQQARGAEEQAQAITTATGTVEELSQAAGQIASAADNVSATAEQTLQSATRGREAVRASLAGMESIKARINEIAARNFTLAEQGRRVSNILATIDELSDQTHLLALNATIESAGAGINGARFGVVAAEVRRLAQDSTRATRAVQEIAVQNQAAIAAAVGATEAGLKEGDAGLQLAHANGATHEAIIAEAERTAQLVLEITIATQQQRTASQQVVLTMREMVDLTRQVAARSQETLETAQQLQAAARALSRPPPPTGHPAIPDPPVASAGTTPAPSRIAVRPPLRP